MPKLLFAHQLRGIAALLIVITHYFGVYFGAQAVVAGVTFSPELQLVAPDWVRHMDFPYFKGPFGVALFFLISGFVIPFSLQKNSGAGFLLARTWRIFPTYLACLGIGLLATYLSARYWQLPFLIDLQRLLMNALLMHNLAGLASLDTVNWTLAIELKFYVVAALCWRAMLGSKPLVFAAIAAAVIALDLALPSLEGIPFVYRVLAGLGTDLNYVLFMLIGTLFYQHYRGLLTLAKLAAGAVLLLAAFIAAWHFGTQRDQVPVLAEYYVYALLVFALCYSVRNRFRPVRVLDFFADISYPLYVVHALTGYVLLKVIMHQGLAYGYAVCVVLAIVTALAWLLHKTIETTSSEYGKRLAGRLRRPATAPAAA
jgi:peptidoglycan/LPS O-acetylase OafA/YrhL